MDSYESSREAFGVTAEDLKAALPISWSTLIGRQVVLLLEETTVAGRLAGAEDSGLWISEVVVSFQGSESAAPPEDVFFHAFGSFTGYLQGGVNAR